MDLPVGFVAVPVATGTFVVESPLATASAAASDAAVLRYDSDRSGTLTKDECMDFIAGEGLSLSRGYVEGAWAVYDTNEDGVLDREEFHSFYQVMLTRSMKRQPLLVEPEPEPEPEPEQFVRHASGLIPERRSR
jgi:hypothetical protein